MKRQNYRPLLKPLKSGTTSTKFLFLTNHISGGPWIHKARALIRFAGPRSSLNTIFEKITNKAKWIELLMLRHVFPQWKDDFRAKNTQIIYRLQFLLASVTGTSSSLSLIPLHQVLSKKCTPSLCYFSSGDALRKKTSKPRIRAEIFDGWEDVRGTIKACPTFLRSSELS